MDIVSRFAFDKLLKEPTMLRIYLQAQSDNTILQYLSCLLSGPMGLCGI